MAVAEALPEPWVPGDTFGARLALIRQRMGGWNVKRIAEFCGLDDQSWRNWERGDTNGPRDYEGTCKKIAVATGCDLRWLMSGGPLTRWNTQSPGLSTVPVVGQMELPFTVDRFLSLV